MRVWAQAAIAAAAMPVVGFITGKVVGEASDRVPVLAWMGVVVYATALAASYAHLRHYYARFDAEGVRAAPFIAFAVEAATFYLSFASVVLGSAWALWGSLVGAGVVFWGNLTSMGLGLKERVAAEAEGRRAEALDPRLSAERAFRGRSVPSPSLGNGDGTDGVPTPFPVEREGGTAWVRETPPMNGVDEERELARLLEALSSPKGPSALARELSWPKSTVARRLKRLVDLGLVQSDGGVYRRTGASA